MTSDDRPQLSVVVLVPRRSRTLQWALERLNGQTIAGHIECVLVAPTNEETQGALQELGRLAGVQTLHLGEMENEGSAKAAGMRAAKAPLVAFLEDHSFPDASWAEALVGAHDSGKYAVVGPVVRNANPASGASWGCFLVYYGQWMEALPEGALRHLPANHSCYRKDVLIAYGERLPVLLQSESVLHRDLLRKGGRLFQERRAIAYHLNYSNTLTACSEYVLASRVFATDRASGWSGLRRAVYACGSPLLPVIRTVRLLPILRRSGLETGVMARAFLAMFSTLVAGALGEMLGYSVGAGAATEHLFRFVERRDGAFSESELAEAAERIRRGSAGATGGS
ncbi:MAG: hypothetical protein H6Q05_4934 [Acidobacteria bacterium]|nr:hypothetical protein [Acidobacteriota bacterium]